MFRDLAEVHPDAIEPYCQLGRMAMFQSNFAVAAGWLRARDHDAPGGSLGGGTDGAGAGGAGPVPQGLGHGAGAG